MRAPRAVVALALVLGLTVSLTACGPSGSSAEGNQPEDELIGMWIHVKNVEGAPGPGDLVEFLRETRDEDRPYKFRGDWGSGSYAADGSSLTLTFMEGPNGAPRGEDLVLQYERRDKDTLILAERGEFALEGSAAVEAFLKSRTD